jgi:hypothetical protein
VFSLSQNGDTQGLLKAKGARSFSVFSCLGLRLFQRLEAVGTRGYNISSEFGDMGCIAWGSEYTGFVMTNASSGYRKRNEPLYQYRLWSSGL